MRFMKWIVLVFTALLVGCSTSGNISEPLSMSQPNNNPIENVTANESEVVSDEIESKRVIPCIMAENGMLYESDYFFGGNVLGVFVYVEEIEY